uniref:Uncharacterized protein n=1 Tax=Arundo donax TaxID=35708 RepID=A0A0A8ZVN2_ARUDO
MAPSKYYLPPPMGG